MLSLRKQFSFARLFSMSDLTNVKCVENNSFRTQPIQSGIIHSFRLVKQYPSTSIMIKYRLRHQRVLLHFFSLSCSINLPLDATEPPKYL